MVFSNGTMLPVSGKYESVNERTLYAQQQKIILKNVAIANALQLWGRRSHASSFPL